MNTLIELIPQNLMNSLGWTLLHSIWQSVAVIGVLFLFNKIFKPSSSNTRYLMYVVSLAAIVVWSLYTFISYYLISISSTVTETLESIGAISITTFGAETINKITSNTFWHVNESYFPILVTIWILGVLLISIKTIGGLWYIQYIKTHHAGLPNERILHKLVGLKAQLKISKRIQIFVSHRINVPMVIGHLKPVILLPIGICTGLSIEEVEAILAHELSHIKRHDYFINMLQSIVEALFFYNPIIWWLSTQIKKERELSCDDVALHIGINKLTFAKALASIQQLKINTTMAMGLGKNKKHLLQRIKRAVEGEKNYKSNSWDKALSLAVIIGALVSLSWYSVIPTDNKEVKSPLTNIVEERMVSISLADTIITEPKTTEESTSIKRSIKTNPIIEIETNVDDLDDVLKNFDVSNIVGASIDVASKADALLSSLDINFDFNSFDLDTIPNPEVLHELEFSELFEHQRKVMEEMKLQLSNLHELDRLNDDLNEEQQRKIEEAVRIAEEEAFKLAELYEKDFIMDKVEMQQLHEKMKEVQKREFEIQEKLEQLNMHEAHNRIEEMEKLMKEKEGTIRRLEENIKNFEAELNIQLINDGYLKLGENLDDIQFKDESIKVNGKEIKEKDAAKYRALKKMHFDE